MANLPSLVEGWHRRRGIEANKTSHWCHACQTGTILVMDEIYSKISHGGAWRGPPSLPTVQFSSQEDKHAKHAVQKKLLFISQLVYSWKRIILLSIKCTLPLSWRQQECILYSLYCEGEKSGHRFGPIFSWLSRLILDQTKTVASH